MFFLSMKRPTKKKRIGNHSTVGKSNDIKYSVLKNLFSTENQQYEVGERVLNPRRHKNASIV